MADSILGWLCMVGIAIAVTYYVVRKVIAEQETLHLEREREQDAWYT